MTRTGIMRAASWILLVLSLVMGLLGGFWSWLGRDQLAGVKAPSEGLEAALLFLWAWTPWLVGSAIGMFCGWMGLRRA